MARPEATAELIRTLDEKYVANAIAFEAMIAAAALHPRRRDPRARRRRHRHRRRSAQRLDALTWHVPAMRQRLAPTPLRVDHARLGSGGASSTSPTT